MKFEFKVELDSDTPAWAIQEAIEEVDGATCTNYIMKE